MVGNSSSCLETAQCLQTLSGGCQLLSFPESVATELERHSSNSDIVKQVEFLYRSFMCSIYDTPGLKQANQDPCSLLQEELDLATRLQQLYPNHNHNSSVGTTVVHETVIEDILVEEKYISAPNQRSDANLYTKLVMEDIPRRRESVFRHQQQCVLARGATEAVNSGFDRLGFLTITGGLPNAVGDGIDQAAQRTCEGIVNMEERKLAREELKRTRLDIHDSRINALQLETIDRNVRQLASRQEQLDTKTVALASQSMALDNTVLALSNTVEALQDQVNANFTTLFLRLDDLETSIVQAVKLSTAVDAAVTVLTNVLQTVLEDAFDIQTSSGSSSSGKGKGKMMSRKKRALRR